MTYWYIKHAPVVLLEFKLLSKEFLLPAMKKDLKKLREIEQKYEGVKRVYFCYLADEILSEEEYQTIVGETKIENLRVCHGTSNGKDWEVI